MLQIPSTAPETRVIKQLLKRLAIMFPPKVQNHRLNENRIILSLIYLNEHKLKCIIIKRISLNANRISEEKVERAMKNDKII